MLGFVITSWMRKEIWSCCSGEPLRMRDDVCVAHAAFFSTTGSAHKGSGSVTTSDSVVDFCIARIQLHVNSDLRCTM